MQRQHYQMDSYMKEYEYNPRLSYQCDVLSTYDRDQQHQQLGCAPKPANKTSFLRDSSSMCKTHSKETNRERGLTYSSVTSHYGCDYDIGGRQDRSFKIACSGPVDIVTDLHDLDYEYVPKKRKVVAVRPEEEGMESTVGMAPREMQANECHQPNSPPQPRKDFQHKLHRAVFVMLMAVGLCIGSDQIQQSFFAGFSTLRTYF